MKLQKEYWYIVTVGIISGLIVFGGGVFAKLGFSLYEISTVPYMLGIPIFLFLLASKKLLLTKKTIPIILLYGLVEAGIVLAQFAAPILGASIAVTVLLLYIQPLWTTLISKFFLREKISKSNILACFMVLAGVLLIINPFDLTNTTLSGFIAALLGGIFLSGWVSVGSHASKSGIPPSTTMFAGNFTAQSIIFLSLPFVKSIVKDESITRLSLSNPALFFLVVFGAVTFILNHYLYLKGTQKVKAVDAGIIMLLEPVVGAVLAAIFLHQSLTLGIIVGGMLILFANYLIIKKAAKS